jgi:hypothetical protein
MNIPDAVPWRVRGFRAGVGCNWTLIEVRRVPHPIRTPKHEIRSESEHPNDRNSNDPSRLLERAGCDPGSSLCELGELCGEERG